MTFEEAIELKNKIGVSYQLPDGKIARVLITPKTDEFFEEYMDELVHIPLIDESSKRFARDDSYKLMAIVVLGVNVFAGKELKESDVKR